MGDSHTAGADPHLPHGLLFSHVPIDGMGHPEHDLANEYENTAHHSLSPFQLNMPAQLSRPPSMASMSNFALPPVQPPLSRVGSLSNFNFHHQPSIGQNPLFFQGPLNGMPAFFTPQYMSQQQQSGQQQSQQQTSPNQLLAFPMVGTSFLPFPSDFSTITTPQAPPSKQNGSTKNKKGRGKRSAQEIPPPPVLDIPAPKAVRMEKVVEKPKKVQSTIADDVKPQRSRNPSSVYRGVSKCSKDGRWQARIRVKRQVTYLGRFVKEEDAARKYDEAARIHHGDKAVLNFPTEEDKQLGRKQAASVVGGVDDDDESED